VRTTCCLLLLSLGASATTITNVSSMMMSPVDGVHTCLTGGLASANCISTDSEGYASAEATATDGAVGAWVRGGAFGAARMASAYASAYSSQDYLFTEGSGSGLLSYVVALSGSNVADVHFNGNLYQLSPNGRPTSYEFIQEFTYGQPVTVLMTLILYGSWLGSVGECGSVHAFAQLESIQVLGNNSQRSFAMAVQAVPEPSTAILWICALVLILAGGLQRRRQRR
jgi:hypothetical protein